MKLGFGNYWIELNAKDFITKMNNKIKELFANLKKQQIKELIIAIIDDRYYINGYINRWGIIKCSENELQKSLSCITEYLTGFWQNPSISEIFNKTRINILYENDELSDYETDTPDQFDFYIYL